MDVFGRIDAVTTFLRKNQLTAIIRAHEAQFDGYKMQMINEQTQIPRVITIFSAPNYCDVKYTTIFTFFVYFLNWLQSMITTN